MDGLRHPPGSAIEINGHRLWCELEGEGEDLLLIAGGPGSPHTYMHALSPLADRFRLVHFDALGTGQSDRAPKTDYTFDRQVDDLEALRKRLGIERWNIVGSSYGGMVAIRYAERFPGAVRRLVLVSSPHSAAMFQAGMDNALREVEAQCPETWARITALRGQGHLTSSPELFAEMMAIPDALVYFYDPAAESRTTFEQAKEVYFAIAGPDAVFRVGGSLAAFDGRAALARMTIPVLVIGGRFDRVVPPREILSYRTVAPDAEVLIFERSGHLPFVEEPGHFFEVVRAFLARPLPVQRSGPGEVR